MSKDRRYWRPESEKLLEELGRMHEAEMWKLMTQPIVIQTTEEEAQRMAERFSEQMIYPVNFSNVTSATVPNVTMEDLLRNVEEYKRQVAIDKEAAEFLKELERLAFGYSIEPLPIQAAAFDLQEYCRFRLLDERMTAESLAVYEPRRKTE